MEHGLTRGWWALALRGVFAIIFGLLAFAWPGLTLEVLVIFWGAYALVDGAFAIAAAFTGHGRARHWWALLLEGLFGIGAGVVTFLWPGITALALVYLISAWAVVTGVFEIVAAVRLRRYVEGEWALALSGVVSVLLGAMLAFFPGAGALAMVWWIGAYAVVAGVLMLALAFRLRDLSRGRTPATAGLWSAGGRAPARP